VLFGGPGRDGGHAVGVEVVVGGEGGAVEGGKEVGVDVYAGGEGVGCGWRLGGHCWWFRGGDGDRDGEVYLYVCAALALGCVLGKRLTLQSNQHVLEKTDIDSSVVQQSTPRC